MKKIKEITEMKYRKEAERCKKVQKQRIRDRTKQKYT